MTKAERTHYDKVSALGCIVCQNLGYGKTPAEIHHITGAGLALKSHYEMAIPLCPGHHRTGGFGVAIHSGEKTWQKNFGTQKELLERVRLML